ncbi:low-density lipoprotein receptor-like [Mya arenaria]|uniref:low-density lipoprotein receptor-like n=1 Tax=Mya arenaria TaxID=6604 RepID=UPI0022E8F003|nr:low-density lipoprotein receptor-like [Mya arenaria]
MGFASFVVLAIVAELCSGNHGYFPSKMSFGKAGYYQYPTAYHGSTAACVGQFYCKNTQSSSGISWMQPSSQPECVNKMKICDGMMDCSNGADEKGCPPQCAKMGMISCRDRKNCGSLCDGVPDCHDMDDERHCPAGCFCPENHYLCKDMKTCVSKKQLCDGNNDCPACDDEDDCPAECKCGERSYLCMGKGKCINIKQVCDGDNDCPMNEDETCRSGCQCKQGEYQCDEGTVCIQNEQLCEGSAEAQCPNADDEDPLICI